MKSNSGRKVKPLIQAALLAALLAIGGQAGAVTYDLCAGATSVTTPGGDIPMWGFGLDDADPATPCAASVPGPQLNAPVGDTTLTVNLRNELTVPVSMIISGQQAAMTPVFFTDGQGRSRVRSFTHETPAGGSAVYSWGNLKPGTFLYSSGTHAAVQVQMGLYGGLIHDAAAGEAYAGIAYDNEVVMLYSEIDPALHTAVVDGSYGTPGYPSTLNYVPKYFLVNGAPFAGGITPAIPAGASGQRTLIRFLNAGLEDHVMVLQGNHMRLVAEDGNTYPWSREQYSVLLAAGKTKDAIFTPGENGTFPVYDRRLRVGMMAMLSVAAGVPGPTAVDDSATVAEDSSGNVIAVLANDTAAVDPIDPTTVVIGNPAVNGQTAVNAADGSVSYTPNPDFSGVDGFTYTVRDTAGNLSNTANVTITVTPINDLPVAVNDAFTVEQDSSNNSFNVLGNDSDVDGDTLTISAVGATDNGGVAGTDGATISYSPAPGFSGTETFGYDITDGNGGTASATVTVTVTPVGNLPPVANDDLATVTRNVGSSTNSVTINVVANDTDADGTVDASTVTITTNPLNGDVVNNGNGTVTYTPKAGKRGSDAFGYTVDDNLGATSNVATVRVNIVK